MNNLVPMASRPEEERKAIASKGGTASTTVRRTKKKVREMLRDILFSADVDPELKQEMIDFGYDEQDICILAGILMRLTKKALQGDHQCIRTLIEYWGEDPEIEIKREELKIKKAELKLKKDLVKQQTIKLRKFNFGDNGDNWILTYNPAEDPMLQVLQQLAKMDDDPEPIHDPYNPYGGRVSFPKKDESGGIRRDLEVYENHTKKIMEEQRKLKEDLDTL